MAKFRFIGQHTGDRDRIVMGGYAFVGDEPADVVDEVDIRDFRQNVEFEEVPEVPTESERARQANAETHMEIPAAVPDEAPKPKRRRKKK